MRPKVLMIGGLRLADSLGTITRGLQKVGAYVEYIPSRSIFREGNHKDVIRAVEKAFSGSRFDLAFFWNPKGEYPSGLATLAQKNGAQTVYYTIDDPLAVDTGGNIAPFECDVVLTCCQDSVKKYQANGLEAYLMYPPVDVDYHYCDYRSEIAVDISFSVGNCYVKSRFSQILADRRDIIRTLKGAGTIALYGKWADSGWGGPNGLPEMEAQYKGFIPYDKLRKVFASSRINLNSHVRPDGFMYLNMRTFECLGSGGFMLSDAVKGIENIFDLGVHLDVWRDLGELLNKTLFYLTHDDVRHRIAMRGYAYSHERFNNILFAERILGLLK